MAAPLPPDPYLGEIRLCSGNFAPKNWALCNGQLLNIAGNEDLFFLIGTIYGGDGTSNFALPDLQGRVPLHQGVGFPVGKNGGEESVTLSVNELPGHQHTVYSNEEGGSDIPTGNLWGFSSSKPYVAAQGDLALNIAAISTFGKGKGHENRIPFLAISYIIALKGGFPT